MVPCLHSNLSSFPEKGLVHHSRNILTIQNVWQAYLPQQFAEYLSVLLISNQSQNALYSLGEQTWWTSDIGQLLIADSFLPTANLVMQ